MKISYPAYLLSCLLCAALLTGCTGRGPAENAPDDTAASSAPDESGAAASSVTFEARTLDGGSVSSELFADSKLTMLNVWATYCNPCLNEMPGLGELAGAYASEDFQLIGIISDVSEDADEAVLQYASDLVEETGAGYPHLLLNESLYTALLTEVSAVPTTFFVDQDGQVLDTVVGAMERSAWEEKINALLEP
jgi:thiol-disulfide isomerase/thioredoxin